MSIRNAPVTTSSLLFMSCSSSVAPLVAGEVAREVYGEDASTTDEDATVSGSWSVDTGIPVPVAISLGLVVVLKAEVHHTTSPSMIQGPGRVHVYVGRALVTVSGVELSGTEGMVAGGYGGS